MAKQAVQGKVAAITEVQLKSTGIHGLSFAYEKYETPALTPRTETQKVVGGIAQYGANNDLDAHIVGLFEKSPTHSAIINSAASYIAGNGLTIEGATPIEVQKLFGSSNPRKWTKSTGRSKKTYNGFGVLVRYSLAGIVAQLEYIEYGTIRKKISTVKIDGRDEAVVIGYYTAPRWKKSGTRDVLEYPMFDPSKVMEITYPDGSKNRASWKEITPELIASGASVAIVEPVQLYVYDEESLGSSGYATPAWWAADMAIKFDALYMEFHTNNISNGFMPTVILEVQGIAANDEAIESTEANLKRTGGANGNRVMAVYPETTQEGKPTVHVHTIDNHMHDGKFEKIHQSAIQSILSAHQLSSPVLAGLPPSGNLSPNAGERESALAAYMANVIYDDRQDILDALQMIFTTGGRETWVPVIKDKNPYTEVTTKAAPDAQL